ncbi:hypothetical protein FRB93_012158 [Tulasnella sp. JGI-2019a]|nr:hypothetical protein FRB93_012158 [Tulasnella sp. JGI-2019a]
MRLHPSKQHPDFNPQMIQHDRIRSTTSQMLYAIVIESLEIVPISRRSSPTTKTHSTSAQWAILLGCSV